ncbi:MAG: FtsW/RodA/SpoVE family cell cycle protein [Selenomonadales bacterium]|nr:FtsW/RodA/SpoVE family cell cycle protein [Selenomonadales bacterium]
MKIVEGLKSLVQGTNNKAILISVTILIIIGLINIFSASYPKALDENAGRMFYFVKQIVWIALGTLGMVIVSKINYRCYRRQAWMTFFAAVGIGLLILTELIGISVKGSTRWLEIFGFRFQPSEVAKAVSVFLAAGCVGSQLKSIHQCSFKSPWLGAVFVMFGFVVLQPDLGTATIIIAIAVAIYCASDIPKKMYLILTLIVGGGLCFLAGREDYRSDRIQAWYDPWQYPDSIGYQAVQAEMAIGSGGWTGMGWGQGPSKFFYLPEAHTDFAFAIFCQEWGFIWTLLCIIVPFIVFSFYGVCIARQSEDYYGKMLAFGITLLLSGQAFANMLMVLGTFPVIGVPLPFISYGGTSLVINMLCVGALLNISEQNEEQRLRAQRNKEAVEQLAKQPVKLKLVSPLRDGRFNK